MASGLISNFMEKYSDNFRVRISDADSRGYLKIPALLGMFQEVARDHAEMIGVGWSALGKDNLGWALSKIVIAVERLPQCGERVTIFTWPSTRNKVFSEREFSVLDNDGKTIISARSLWVLFDLTKRRLERLDRLPQWPLIGEFANGETYGDLPSVPKDGEIFSSSFGVRKDDLDINGHVNNPVYFTWALEPVPEDFYDAHLIRRARIWFLNEAFRGDRPESSCQIDGLVSRHSIMSQGRDSARALIEWINA